MKKAFTYYDPPPLQISNRDFLMGFVPVLLGPSNNPIQLFWYWYDAREIASTYGDITSLLYHAWDDCDGGEPHLTDLSPAIDMIQWMHKRDVQVLLGLEITTDVRRNVGFCPGDTFAVTHVWDDLEAQLRFLFKSQGPGPAEFNYPDYLMLGIEMNMYYIARPWDWENYAALLDHLYQVVREYTENTKVIVSFQFEVLTLEGFLPRDPIYPRQWEIYGDLSVDLYGISVYPGLERFICFWDPLWMRDGKFNLFTDPEYNPRGLPIAITETGYPVEKKWQLINWYCGSELHQHSFLVRMAELLQDNQAEFMIWWSLHEGASPDLAEFFTSMRLVTQDRACYPEDCYPFEPDCVSPCPLDPQGSMALDVWQDLYSLPPSE